MSSGMQSFYGGPNGQSFEIKEIFKTRKAMQADADAGWASSIGVGEYVIISYGLPNTSDYIYRRDIDLQEYHSTYNSTLWQKIYADNNATATNGISYKLIASMTGYTPRMDINFSVLDAGETPTARWDNNDVDNPKLILEIPQSQKVERLIYSVLDANQDPSVVWDDTDVNNPIIRMGLPQSQILQEGTTSVIDADQSPSFEIDDDNINAPIINFSLPQSQLIGKGVITAIDADEDPDISIDSSNINNPLINFNLPKSQVLQEGNTTVLDADQDPSFSIDSTNINEPVLNFNLPQSQVMDDPELEVTGPLTAPTVVLDDTNINSPKLQFTLPRAVEFIYGDLMGEDRDYSGVSDQTLENCEEGDYYINNATGFIYLAIARSAGGAIDFHYVACLQAPKPVVSAHGIDPYVLNQQTGEYDLVDPTITRTVSSTGWTLDFGLPHEPGTITTPFTFVGVDEAGNVVLSRTGTNALEFNFTIPRGARFFVGIDVDDTHLDTVVQGAAAGDYYINNSGAGATNAGEIYKFNGTAWVKQSGYGLQGPTGEALNISATVQISSSDVADDTLAAVGAYLTTQGYDPYPNEIISVIYHDNDANDDKAYWYYKSGAYSDPNRAWNRSVLTGGIGSFVERSYSTDTKKVYNTAYVNTLLVTSPTDKSKQSYNATQIDILLAAKQTAIDNLQSQVDALVTRITALEVALAKDIEEQLSWGKIGVIGYKLLEEEPDDWTTDWTNYYELDTNGIPQHLTDASAPVFAANIYYSKDN